MTDTAAQTATVSFDLPGLAAILAEIEAAPILLGSLLGCAVLLDKAKREIVIARANPFGDDLRFSVDHPYVAGTPIEKAARAALREEAKP